jgi:hypothetical protein
MKLFATMLILAGSAWASKFEKEAPSVPERQSPKSPNGKAQVTDTLQGNHETTKLPETARHDARGGVFI